MFNPRSLLDKCLKIMNNENSLKPINCVNRCGYIVENYFMLNFYIWIYKCMFALFWSKVTYEPYPGWVLLIYLCIVYVNLI